MSDLRDVRPDLRRNDANPLNWSLPAEVVSRRRPQVKKVLVKPPDEVVVEMGAALATKPNEARIRWLNKAFDMAKDGRTSSRELFDIISNRKFSAGLPLSIGRKICSIANDNATLFSEKQQRYMLSPDWILSTKYGPYDDGKAQRATQESDDEIDAKSDDEVETREDDAALRRKEAREDEAGGWRLEANEGRRFTEGGGEGRRARETKEDGEGRQGRRFVEGPRTRESGEGRRLAEGSSERPTRTRDGDEDREPVEGQRTGENESAPKKRRLSRDELDAIRAVEEKRERARRAILESHFASDDRPQERRSKRDEPANSAPPGIGRIQMEQQQRMQKQEEDADSSLLMLERLTQRQEAPPAQPHRKDAVPKRRQGCGRRSQSRSASLRLVARQRNQGRGREKSRSRSLSIQAASPSPSPRAKKQRDAPRHRDRGPPVNFEEALRKRMAQREASDTSRCSVVWTREDLRGGQNMKNREKWAQASAKRLV